MRRVIMGLALASAAGCANDQSFAEIRLEAVAVTTGDFDRVEGFLNRNAVAHTVYEGYIANAVYDEEAEPENIATKTETLFAGVDEEGNPLLHSYDATFVNSGTRGFGAFEYNGTDPDDVLVSDPAVIDNVRQYLQLQRVMVVSDWSYDLVEAAYPDLVEFLNEAEGLDAAQVGTSDSVVARVVDTELAGVLQSDQLELTFDFSYWAVMASVSDDAQVYLRGDIEYRSTSGEGSVWLEDVPLLIGYDTGGGRLFYSSFSWAAQKPQVTDLLLLHLVEGLEVDSSAPQAEVPSG